MPYGRNITYLSPVIAVKMKESKEDDHGDRGGFWYRRRQKQEEEISEITTNSVLN